MSNDLTAWLGCVQSEISQSDPSGQPQIRRSCRTERVVLSRPSDGAHHVVMTCKHCQQEVRVEVRSRRSVQRQRLVARLALAVSVCLWVAGTALVLLYFLDPYSAAPGREVLLAGVLVALGVVVWASADGQAAFAGDIAAGCTIERAPAEVAWARSVSPGVRQSLPRHVLLEPEQERAAAGLGAELVRTVSAVLHKPSATPTTVPSAAARLKAGATSRAA